MRVCSPFDICRDKKLFAEIVCSDFFSVSGTTPEGRPILWVRRGHYQQNDWSLRANSAQYWAFMRGCIFGFQAPFQTVQGTRFPDYAAYIDDSGAKNLGFNLTFLRTLTKHLKDLIPFRGYQVIFFGASPATEIVARLTSLVLKGATITAIPGNEVGSVYPFVKEKNSIPCYMIKEEDSAVDGNMCILCDKNSPGFSWCYRRLVRGGPSLTAAEVFNPQPGDFEEDDSDEDTEEKKIVTKEVAETERLEAIEEGDDEEDDGGW